ncbi:MAG TPA: lipopolysaccharide transport periplasmic protein LptA [Hyphomicrobiales bacterium]|nr:lipopolysaccharide transport periplasmic protein LptA [Hyphomicrobiales bacterium]
MIPPQASPEAPRRALLLLLAALLASPAQALPEDANQPLNVQAPSAALDLNLGQVVYKGNANTPAVITQGTMRISGEEIIVERSNGVITRVTAKGAPARFQQQPTADQALVHASGAVLVFNNEARVVTADGNAEFSQAETTINGQHIEYDLETRSASADGGDSGELVNMKILPAEE